MKYRFYNIHKGEEISSCGDLFDSRAKLRECLISYHSADWDNDAVEIETLSLDDILEHGQWELEEVAFSCPVCGDGQCVYKPWLSTRVYSCDQCPFIGMEYSSPENMKDFNDYINHIK